LFSQKGEGKAANYAYDFPGRGNRKIIKNKKFELKPMSPDEAAMQRSFDKDFCVYQCQQRNIMSYRRKTAIWPIGQ
jgi:hypothetical protein